MTSAEMKILYDAIDMRNAKIKAYQQSIIEATERIDKLHILNNKAYSLIDKYWEEKYSKYKKGK